MYHKTTHIHFVGIGGIGMSGIARILKQMGYTISGCDSNLQQTTIRSLHEQGVMLYQQKNNAVCSAVPGDVIVYSTAIDKNHPDLIYATNNALPLVHRSTMLAEIMRTKFNITVSGAHGKTTTTSLITHILLTANIDPTYVIGGYLTSHATNANYGTSDYCVAEADESDRSFLNLPTTLNVITNIDFDHAETYANLNQIVEVFNQFIQKIPFYGKLFICSDDTHSTALTQQQLHIPVIRYGFAHDAHVRATNIITNQHSSTFTVTSNYFALHPTTVTLSMPGIHNVYNSLAAFSICKELKIPTETIVKALNTFTGVDRRFSLRGTYRNARIFDDYGHHPREIMCTLESARKQTHKGLIVIFQPHRFSRTQALWNDFVTLFATQNIERLFITDIYPASELPITNITSAKLVEAIKEKNNLVSVHHIPYDAHFMLLKKQLAKENIDAHDILLFVGAGTITNVAQELAQKEPSIS